MIQIFVVHFGCILYICWAGNPISSNHLYSIFFPNHMVLLAIRHKTLRKISILEWVDQLVWGILSHHKSNHRARIYIMLTGYCGQKRFDINILAWIVNLCRKPQDLGDRAYIPSSSM